MTEPTIEASIAWQKFRIGRLQTKLCEPVEIAQEEAILASLERLKSLDAQPVSETVAWMTEFGRVISVKEKEWAVSKIDEGGEFAITAKAALSYNIKLGVIK